MQAFASSKRQFLMSLTIGYMKYKEGVARGIRDENEVENPFNCVAAALSAWHFDHCD